MRFRSPRSGGQRWAQRGNAILIGSLFAAVAGGASAVDVKVTVQPQGTPPPSGWKCGGGNASYEICVDQEPITPPGANGTPVAIEWNLRDAPGWSFDGSNGIVIELPWQVRCNPNGSTCNARHHKDGKRYKYTINLTNGTTPIPWDPTIQN